MLGAAAVAAGAGLAYVVGHDGEPGWQLARVLAVVALSAVVWWLVTHGGRVASGVAAVVAGLAAVPVGVGVAVPHATKAGLHAMTVAGSLVLIGGLVLLAGGAVALMRTVRWWWRVPATVVLLVAALLGVWSLGQAVAATNVPPTELGSATPADRGLRYSDVEFPAADGVMLSGWYVPSGNGAAVVLLHGAGSTRSAVLDHAAVLADHGYGVLLYDARGHGRSDGRAMDFGWYGDQDVAGAVAFLQRQDDVDPGRIAAVGLSMGGEQAIGAAATNQAIAAVVAEGATNRTAGDKDWLSEEFGGRGALQERLEAVTYRLADLLTAASPPITLHDAVVAAAPRPVLLIAGAAVHDEPLAAEFIQQASPGTVEVWIVPDTGHTAGLDTHPVEWEARVTGFLDQALAAGEEGGGT